MPTFDRVGRKSTVHAATGSFVADADSAELQQKAREQRDAARAKLAAVVAMEVQSRLADEDREQAREQGEAGVDLPLPDVGRVRSALDQAREQGLGLVALARVLGLQN